MDAGGFTLLAWDRLKATRLILFLLTVSTALAQNADPITLQSPRDFQVFQRPSKTRGTILVAGHTGIGGDSIEARIAGDWQLIALDASGDFHGALSAAAGGWYEFELRVRKAGQTVASTRVPHVGIGEVFVIGGQSNATNYGEVRQQTRSGMVAALGPTGWSLANDPQP